MDNKKLGIILILVCIGLGFLVYTFNSTLNAQEEAGCECEEMQEGGVCSMDQHSHKETYFGIILVSIIAALGLYLIFFERSQKEIVSTLEKHRRVQTEEEKFEILLKGLDADEKKVIKAVKEQEGISQQTLRIRTDLHKSKLSVVLDGLEKKDLIRRIPKKKTKLVFLKFKL